MDDQEPEERSRAAGGCVLLTLGGAAVGAVWAASPDAAVIALWAVGAAAVWWAARRRKGPDQPLPSPTERGAHTGVDVHEACKAAAVATDPNGVMSIVHPVGEQTSHTRNSQ